MFQANQHENVEDMLRPKPLGPCDTPAITLDDGMVNIYLNSEEGFFAMEAAPQHTTQGIRDALKLLDTLGLEPLSFDEDGGELTETGSVVIHLAWRDGGVA